MNEKFSLKALPREILGKKVKLLRQAGQIPAVIYGGKGSPVSITLDKKEFEKVYGDAGSSSLIEVDLGGKKENVLAQEPQNDPVTDRILHVDFIRVRMDEKIKTEIPLHFVGESKAVEQDSGTLVTPRDSIEVECLPGDLVHEIEIDLGTLKDFESQIKTSNITAPAGIEILTNPDDVIALVEPPRSEEELAELEKPTAEQEAEAVEAVAGAKEEGAEGTEPVERIEGTETPAEKSSPEKPASDKIIK